jgi:uncharacterized protein
MKIAFDFDEVTVNFLDPFHEYYFNKTGKKFQREDYSSYDFWKIWNISKEEAIRVVNEFHENYNVENILPQKDAQLAISQLTKGEKVRIVTSRPKRYNHLIEAWFKIYLPNKQTEIYNAGDFEKNGNKRKANICLDLGVNVLLDDSGETALECASYGVSTILFDKPWNKNYDHGNVKRVKSWIHALREIELLKSTTIV